MTQETRLHGRGGAGNFAAKPAPNPAEKPDFTTPTIKSNTYTTGRGGQGNMATNLPDFPEYSRAAQDVETPAHHEKEAKGTYHWGRGGQGNVMTVGKDEKAKVVTGESKPIAETKAAATEKEKDRRPSLEVQGGNGGKRRGSFQEIVEKGKGMLGLGGKKEGSPVVVEK